MPRVLLIAILAALLLVPATGASSSRVHVRGTVGAKSQVAHLVALKAARQKFSLRVPGSLSAIRVGQRVELRGSTLRSEGRGSSVLAAGVTVVGSQPLAGMQTPKASDDENDEDQDGAQADHDDDDDQGGPGLADDDNDDDHGGPGSGDDDAKDDD